MEKTMVELFAGVGGFRVGLDKLQSGWKTVWFSQWEPGAKTQWAHECYVSHFGDVDEFTGIDIAAVDKKHIPDHTLICGGFPCQDYSVAHTLKSSHGIEGKKGVLWWQINETLAAKHSPFCFFENVDRLLKSPAKQRGRDFGIMLACLNNLDYSVEWRVVNAAEYGAAQRRRRIFIFAYKNNTEYGKSKADSLPEKVISSEGFMARAFPITNIKGKIKDGELFEDLVDISDNFKFEFENAGFLRRGKFYTCAVEPKMEMAKTLGEIMIHNASDELYLSEESLEKWRYMKGAKKINRIAANGHPYVFSEGPIAFPDPWDKPGRTMLTSEGTTNRSTHVVEDLDTGKLRLLDPVEAERMQGFPDNWTSTMPNRNRYFCMGNALVVPMITRMGAVLDEIIEKENQ